MGKVIIQDATTKNPLNLIGLEAGVCWNAPTDDERKNAKRAIDCIISGHGRVEEFPQVYMVLEGYSARVIREFYTHIAGGPTRLQESTRYINCGKFDYIIPPSIDNNDFACLEYVKLMKEITETYQSLEKIGIPREDLANILPLGMTSKIVVRTNLRHLIDMAHQRLCNRAYWEFRQLMKDMMKALKEYSEEWSFIVSAYFIPKCEVCGYCVEKNCCKRKPTKEEFTKTYEIGLKAQKSPFVNPLCDDGK